MGRKEQKLGKDEAGDSKRIPGSFQGAQVWRPEKHIPGWQANARAMETGRPVSDQTPEKARYKKGWREGGERSKT